MPDIAMCKGEGCPNEKLCYRHTADPSPYLQTYFAQAPYKYSATMKWTCRYYWPQRKSDEGDNR